MTVPQTEPCRQQVAARRKSACRSAVRREVEWDNQKLGSRRRCFRKRARCAPGLYPFGPMSEWRGPAMARPRYSNRSWRYAPSGSKSCYNLEIYTARKFMREIANGAFVVGFTLCIDL